MMERTSWVILVVAVLAGALGGWFGHPSSPTPTADRQGIGRPAPALVLSNLDGQAQRLSDQRGHPVLLNFWASWCAPCIKEMPLLNRWQNEAGAGAPTVIGIAMDDPSRVRAFLLHHPVDYPIWLGRSSRPDTLRQFGDDNDLLPYSVLISSDGRVLDVHLGPVSAARWQAWRKLASAPR